MSRFKGLDKEELDGRMSDDLPWNPGLVEKEKRNSCPSVVKSEKMPMKMAKSSPLASQGKMFNKKTTVELESGRLS